jgi:hypothetical protein
MLAFVSGKLRPVGDVPPAATPTLPALLAPPALPASPPLAPPLLAPEFAAPLAALLPPMPAPAFAPAPAVPGEASCDDEPHATVASGKHRASKPIRQSIRSS